MALKGGTRFTVRFEDIFPNGCVLVPDSIAEAQDYNETTRARTPAVDKVTGQRVWQVRVMDMDPDLAGRSREVGVKILANARPVPAHNDFAPVEFEGMSVTPYVGNNGRLAYSFRATGFTTAQPTASSRTTAA